MQKSGIMDWTKLADEKSLQKAVSALNANGIDATVVETGKDAREKLLSMLPEGSEVMTVTSATIDQIGAAKEIDESGKYVSIRKKLASENDPAKRNDIRRKLSASDYAVGSVHAVTEKGELIIASATGSQLASYAYTASKIILVVGTQKIVKDLDQGFKRIYEHTLPLETERMKKAYGMGSWVSKILVFEKERPGRITVIFVKEKLGF